LAWTAASFGKPFLRLRYCITRSHRPSRRRAFGSIVSHPTGILERSKNSSSAFCRRNACTDLTTAMMGNALTSQYALRQAFNRSGSFMNSPQFEPMTTQSAGEEIMYPNQPFHGRRPTPEPLWQFPHPSTANWAPCELLKAHHGLLPFQIEGRRSSHRPT